jgi:adenine-specific DNA-methyltransferase
MNNYNQLRDVLNDIFELNKADLDFGIYRIMNQKRKQVNEFIEKQLPEDIKKALSETQTSDKTEIENELKTLKKNLDDAGIVAGDSPKYKLLNERLLSLDNTDVLEQEVFSHLANFFKRYYKDGDFISMRRYKNDVYSIPYEGEEVKLHWANHDQYYIKSSENFKNYSFNTPEGKKVTFQLKEVGTEQNNNKTQGDAERRFAIYSDLPVEEVDDELFLNFIYEPFNKSTKQESLINEALEVLVDQVPSNFSSVFNLSPTEKNGKRTLLEKHINDYVSKNSFDYFIHKDLGSFLSRELDFYIKNEVLYIDDINTKQSDFFVAQLSKVKAIKIVAGKVINFLAQIENFQKKLWLKKKFVIRTDYCITLDKIPQSYYAEIFQNKAQIQEWKTLFDVDIKNEEEMVFEQFLVLDTKFFDEGFKDRLLAEFENVDEETNGIMINSENFQALNLLLEKYFGKINVTYIDPPYNAKSSEIIYKNSFKHSSWLSLMENRLSVSKSIIEPNGIHVIAIDEIENFNLGKMLENVFSNHENATISIVHNPTGQQGSNFSYTHEFAHFIYPSGMDVIGLEDREDNNRDAQPDIRPLRNVSSGKNHLRESAANCFYPILVKDNQIIGFGPVSSNDFHPGSINIRKDDGIIEIYPIDPQGVESKWVFARDTVESILSELSVKYDDKKGTYDIIRKKSKFRYKSLWNDKRYSANSWGSVVLNNIIDNCPFQYPKSIYTVMDCVDAGLGNNRSGIVLDYFAGSGTTGHAVIKLNRKDQGNRKFLLVEMGEYFNSVTKPRTQKVIYSDKWQNAKPQDKNGVSQFFKYQNLESYEDTLNNLVLNSQLDQAKLDFSREVKEEYLIQYMLEAESREHLFNLEIFRKPFDFNLNVTENNELKPTKVDLVETFNYLIGLYITKVQRVRDIKVVEGVTRSGQKTLVIWRDLETTNHDDVEKLIRRFYDSQRTKEFDQIFINGDHHLENLRQEGDQFKVKMIEETFFKKMFNETEL